MKKFVCLLVAMLMLLSLAACGKEEVKNPAVDPTPDDTKENYTSDPATEKTIVVRSLDELETLRQLLQESNEGTEFDCEFGQYCERSDYEKYLELYDTLPRLSLMEGKVTWIAQYGDDTLMVTTKNENEEWFRIEYEMAFTDVSELKRGKDTARFEEAIVSKDNRLAVYSECRTTREDGMEHIIWKAMLDDMPVYVVYCSNEKGITAEAMFTELTVIDPAK